MLSKCALTGALFASAASALVIKGHSTLHAAQHAGVHQALPTPMFTDETMPAVSTTLLCIMNLTVQYFVIYTALAILRTYGQMQGMGSVMGLLRITETAASTVVYAPMLSVLFLGTRMRAIQLAQGETEKYSLPQPFVQNAMQVASWAVLGQVLLVLVVPVFTGELNVPVDADGNVDTAKLQASMNATLVYCLTAARYILMACLYGGFSTVIYGVFSMPAPEAIWGAGGAPPVSPAVSATINLTIQFFTVYLALALVRTYIQINGSSQSLMKLEGSLKLAGFTVNMAPMLCVLFIGARMRALQMDPKNGAPQAWAQNCFFLCAYSVMVQALLVIGIPYSSDTIKCKKGDFEGDVVFEGATGGMATGLTCVRYAAVLSLYGGFTAVLASVFMITHPTDPALTPALSPAVLCVMNLACQYFTIYLVLFCAQTAKQFYGVGKGLAECMENARATVMYAPMLSVLFIGARMRSLQLAKATDGTIPPGAGPQPWAQESMFLASWAVLVQVLLVCVLSALYPVQMDADGNVVPPKGVAPWIGYTLNFIRYSCMISMYFGACAVTYAVFTMTPNTIQPYSAPAPLVPGVAVPMPPSPPTPTELIKKF